MILYAFDKVKNKSMISNHSFEKYTSISEVIIDLFLSEVSRIVKSGIHKNYIDINEQSIFIKGKLNLKESIKKQDVKKQITHDELSPNINENHIIKYTLSRLIFSSIPNDLKVKAKKLFPYFSEVSLIMVDDFMYQKVILNRQNKHYEFSLALSVYINKKIIPAEQSGKLSFFDIIQDDETMSTIYEEFLRNFYRIHTTYEVKSKEYSWFLKPLGNTDISWLPKMKTDIEIIVNPNYKIIIDAKFYKNALSSRYELKKLSSNNMYQMNTYLAHNLQFDALRGILLYPAVGYHFLLQYEKEKDYSIEFATIDLSLEWKEIHDSLLNILLNPQIRNQILEN